MTPAARTLSEFAVNLKFEDIPAPVVERAKVCMIDTIAACVFGADFPWSRIIIDYARGASAPGVATIWGTPYKTQASFAALANGALAHAFELDCTYHPSVGVHPGAGLTSPGLAVAQELGSSGKDLITAVVAASEVMYRIGDASQQSVEKLGFHSPGVMGVFGGAVVSGLLMKLDLERMINALGVGGSLCSGLLEFSKSGGGMVKRLHLGQAAESGVKAAKLAAAGLTGPEKVIDGKFGVMNVYCRDTQPALLTAGLGSTWHTLTLSQKCYACHNTAHVPVTAALALRNDHKVSGDDIVSLTVSSSEKMVSHHNILEPADVMMGQYSAPFCVALAFYRDPWDPRVFSEQSLNDPAIRALCRKVKLDDLHRPDNAKATRLTVVLKDGRTLVQDMELFTGMPQQPLTAETLRKKFANLTSKLVKANADHIFSSFQGLEKVANVGQLKLN
jgi:2-methylcitrate dehydratase PrpD